MKLGIFDDENILKKEKKVEVNNGKYCKSQQKEIKPDSEKCHTKNKD